MQQASENHGLDALNGRLHDASEANALLLGEVIGTADQRRTALGFFRQRRDLLVRMG